MASNPFDQFDEAPAASGGNPFDKFDGPKTPSGEWEKFSVPSRPREFVSPEDRPARMVTQQRGTREVPVEGPGGRAIYEAGGFATDALTRVGLPPEVAAAGGFLTNLGGQAATTFLGGGAGKTVEPVAQGAGRFMMRNALRPGAAAMKGFGAEKVERATEAMLTQGISASKGGKEVAQAKIDVLKDTIDDLASRAQGDVLILDVLKPAKDKILELSSAKGGLDYQEKIDMIRKEISKLLDNPDFRNRVRVPVPAANEMKRSIANTEIGDAAYKTGMKPGTEKAAKEVIAKGLREQVERFIPEAKGINREMGDLIEARKLIESRLGRQSGSAPISPWSLLFAMKHPGLAAAHFAENNPQISSALARALYSGGRATGVGAGATAGAGIGAYSGSPPSDLERGIGR